MVCSTSDRRQSQNFHELPLIYHQEYHTLKREKREEVFWLFFFCKYNCKSLNLSKHTFLQAIDVLGVHTEQQTFLVQHVDKVVDVIGSMSARVQLFSKREKRTRVIREVVDIEDGFGVGNIVLLQVGI